MVKKQSRTSNEAKQIIKKTKKYVQECMKSLPPNVHDFKHVDRVRKWAIKIARAEKRDVFLAEMSALLHDIGRSKENPPKVLHANIGAKMAYQFLIKDKLVSEKEAEQIAYAVACHGRGGKGWLVDILQDADKLDGLGAIGIMRGIQGTPALPEYIHPAGEEKTKWQTGEATEILKKQKHVGLSVIENLNFQISWYKNFHTKSARKIARPLVQFMKKYIQQFKKELKLE
jgi:uncharacterized protein